MPVPAFQSQAALPLEVGTKDETAAGGAHGGRDRERVFQPKELVACRYIPEPSRFVAARRQEDAAAAAERDRPDPALMAGDAKHLTPGPDVPEPGVVGTRGDNAAIRREGQGMDRPLMDQA